MNPYQKEVETPIGKHKVIIKTLITGAERESIDNAEMDYVKTTDGVTFNIDTKKVALAKKHKLLAVSVVSIDGDSTDCLARLQKMYEPDYQYVVNQIEAEQKKMTDSMSKLS